MYVSRPARRRGEKRGMRVCVNRTVYVCVRTALRHAALSETAFALALANVRARKLVLRGWREACQGTNRHIDRASRLLCMLVCTYQHMYMYAQSG